MSSEGEIKEKLEQVPVYVVNSSEGLDRLLEVVSEMDSIPLDTEANVLDSYPPQLCLIQIAAPSGIFLVDPLSGIQLEPLVQELVKHELIIHCAELDLEVLYGAFKVVPRTIFDTYLAARLLGHTELSLAALVEKYYGIKLRKKYQRADWRVRPMPMGMVKYAADDVRYLGGIAATMRQRLIELHRIDWLYEWGERLKEMVVGSDMECEEPWRIKGTANLGPYALAIVRALWYWRERKALQLNMPPFRILRNDALVRLAIEAAESLAYDWLLPTHLGEELVTEIKQVIRHAKGSDPRTWPQPTYRTRRLTPEQRDRLSQLITRRNQRARLLGIDPTVIASKSMLTRLVLDWDKYVPRLMRWQRDLLE